MTNTIFTRDGSAWLPTSAALGPWGASLHGGAPAALLCHVLEEAAGGRFALTRLTLDLFRPVPSAPLTVEVRALREGRRLCVHEATLLADGKPLVKATAMHAGDMAVSDVPTPAPCPLPAPADIEEHSLAEVLEAESGRTLPGKDGLHLRLRVRRVSGLAGEGVGGGWLHLPLDLAPGVPLTPTLELAALADFANGVSQRRLERPEGQIGFINADISLHLLRPLSAAPLGMTARNEFSAAGRGIVTAECWQEDGLVARVMHSVLAQPAG